MDNPNGFNPDSLSDVEKSPIVPLMVVGIVVVFILLVVGLFLPTTNWEF